MELYTAPQNKVRKSPLVYPGTCRTYRATRLVWGLLPPRHKTTPPRHMNQCKMDLPTKFHTSNTEGCRMAKVPVFDEHVEAFL